jgi:Trk K+ transport system NAD-binding subunit
MAITVSISFAVASPFSLKTEDIYQKYKLFWDRYQKDKLHPKDEILDTGEATVLIIGMGRVGAGAYKVLNEQYPDKVIGIELSEGHAEKLQQQGFNVKVADATDTDFWNMVRLSAPVEEVILLAMPNHHNNLDAVKRIMASGLDCKIVAIAKHQSEVEELNELGVPSFNLYREAGEGLGREAIDVISAAT